MKIKNTIGLIFCIALFAVGFIIHGNLGVYFNLSAILIVVGGTLGATILSYRLDLLKIVTKVLITSYKSRPKEPEEVVEVLVDLSVKSRFQGILSLQDDESETTMLFLRKALGLVVDGENAAKIKNILKTEMYFFKLRREKFERVLRVISELFPSFGLVGSVVGLIAMLANVDSASGIISTVPIALTSTLYGIIFSNFFFLPFAANLRERTDRELLLKKIIMEGVIAIESEEDPRSLEVKLKSFLTPSSRNVKLVSLKKIQERFNIKSQAQIKHEKKTNPFRGKRLPPRRPASSSVSEENLQVNTVNSAVIS